MHFAASACAFHLELHFGQLEAVVLHAVRAVRVQDEARAELQQLPALVARVREDAAAVQPALAELHATRDGPHLPRAAGGRESPAEALGLLRPAPWRHRGATKHCRPRPVGREAFEVDGLALRFGKAKGQKQQGASSVRKFRLYLAAPTKRLSLERSTRG